MSDEPDNLTLRYLRRIDEKVDRLDGRMSEVALRINEVHGAVIAVRRDQTHDAEIVAHVQTRLDRFSDRLERIERRLDLGDA